MSDHSHDFAHHFDSAEHEFETGKFGMWLFLVTEVMLFGGLFVAFGIFNYLYVDMFKEAHHHLDRIMGSVNTIVLLVSSLTMALAIGFIQRDQSKKAQLML